jgi:hypothetical protein
MRIGEACPNCEIGVIGYDAASGWLECDTCGEGVQIEEGLAAEMAREEAWEEAEYQERELWGPDEDEDD